jgi:nucleoside-diphosphate-sugar epimerase
MRIAITGATGNVGTSLVAALRDERSVDEIVAIARRAARFADPRVRMACADVARDDLDEPLRGVDAVVHLAWLIQPSRDDAALHAVNVEGSRRVFEAAARAGARAIVYLSSIGAYSPGPKDRRVDESWPTDGIPTLFYARHKAAVERLLDRFEREHPDIRVVRLRPGLIFKRDAATGIRRLFAGPLLPSPLVRRGLVPWVPDVPRLRFQAVHSLDVGEALRLALVGDERGPFNVAAEPVLDPAMLGELLGARPVRMRAGVLRALAALTWRARLQPSPPGWLDLALAVPLMDVARATERLGWRPRRSSAEALLELLDGIRAGAEHPTPPLAAATSGPARWREIAGRAGARDADVERR